MKHALLVVHSQNSSTSYLVEILPISTIAFELVKEISYDIAQKYLSAFPVPGEAILPGVLLYPL